MVSYQEELANAEKPLDKLAVFQKQIQRIKESDSTVEQKFKLAYQAAKDFLVVFPLAVNEKEAKYLLSELDRVKKVFQKIEDDFAHFIARNENLPLWTWGKHEEELREMRAIIKEVKGLVGDLVNLAENASSRFERYGDLIKAGKTEEAKVCLEEAFTYLAAMQVKSVELSQYPERVGKIVAVLEKELDDTRKSGIAFTIGALSLAVGGVTFGLTSKAIAKVASHSIAEGVTGIATAGATSSVVSTAVYDLGVHGETSIGHLGVAASFGAVLGPIAHGMIPGSVGRVIGIEGEQVIVAVAKGYKTGKNVINDSINGMVASDKE